MDGGPDMDASKVWSAKLQSASELVDKAVRLEFSRSYGDAFAAYLRGAEQYLWLVRNISDRPLSAAESASAEAHLRTRLKAAGAKALDRAEKIKKAKKDIRPVNRTLLSAEEQSDVLASSARLGQVSMPAWTVAMESEPETATVFEDPEPQPALSRSHHLLSAVFDRRYKQLPSMKLYDQSSPLCGRDIVQDVVTDCSVVTALEVMAQHDRKWGTKLSTQSLYPKDRTGYPAVSPSGRHSLKLHINGCERRIMIDDSLPMTPDHVLACASSRLEDQYWPSLVEKGYLKVMGGYDFLGSNSSIDVHALTGWVPEQVFLQHAGVHREKLWKRLWDAWSHGKCLLTTGTGPLDEKTAAHRGLVPSHNYSVLELREEGHDRLVTLMNPWRRDDSARLRSAPTASSAQWANEIRAAREPSLESGDNIFTVTWESLCVHFDTVYVNWDPSIFSHSLTAHATWVGPAEPASLCVAKPLPSKASAQSMTGDSTADPDVAIGQAWASGQNPQFKLSIGPVSTFERSAEECPRIISTPISAHARSDHRIVPAAPNDEDKELVQEVWLLLVRHTKEQVRDSGLKPNEFIALHVFENDGTSTTRKALKPNSRAKFVGYGFWSCSLIGPLTLILCISKGTYVDGLTTLVRLNLSTATTSLTVVASRHGPPRPATFSLYAYCTAPMMLEELPRTLPHRQQIIGAWTTQSAGGNISNPTFMNNPQFKISVPAPGTSYRASPMSLLFLLEAPRTLPVQMVLSWSSGKRVTALSSNDVIASSGAYQHGLAFLEVAAIQPGTYTLILSSFEPGREGSGPYALMLESSVPLSYEAIPQEGAGMFLRTIRGEWASPERLAELAALTSPSSTRITTLAIGAAAGSPNKGDFSSNPTVLVNIPAPAPVGLQVRLRLDSPGLSPRPHINVALFGAVARRGASDIEDQSQTFALGHELYSSGPYEDHVSGVAIDFKSNARLAPGNYLIVASTFAPNVYGKFRLDVWSERAVDIRALE